MTAYDLKGKVVGKFKKEVDAFLITPRLEGAEFDCFLHKVQLFDKENGIYFEGREYTVTEEVTGLRMMIYTFTKTPQGSLKQFIELYSEQWIARANRAKTLSTNDQKVNDLQEEHAR